MEYNTKRRNIIIPEYGRNVQTMVDYCKTLQNKDDRNLVAQAIIVTMKQVNTSAKDSEDLEQTLWTHLHIMGDYELSIDSPFPMPTKHEVAEKPTVLPYTQGTIKIKHYGKGIENMIEAAKGIEDAEMRQAFVRIIVNQMKKNYLLYNNRSGFTDDQILKDFKSLSKGELTLSDDFEFNQNLLGVINKRRPANSKNRSGNNNQRGNSGRNNNTRNRSSYRNSNQ